MLLLTLDNAGRSKLLLGLTVEDDEIGAGILAAVAAAVAGGLSPSDGLWAVISHSGQCTPQSETLRLVSGDPARSHWATHEVCRSFVPGAPAPAVASSSLVPAAGVLSGEGGHMG